MDSRRHLKDQNTINVSMRFSNAKYSTNWQKLNIGIMMGCVISPIFVLVIEMLLRGTEDTTSKKIGVLLALVEITHGKIT